MQHRYALRFENGERRGETVALTGAGTTFGRRPGNGVQILDASVSGRHAEVVVDERGVLVRDLGSTNGTRVGSERVSEKRLAHGDEILFGNVRLTFIDGSIDPSPPSSGAELLAPTPALPASPAAPAESAGEQVRTISADKLARSGKRSLVAGGLAVALLAGGAGAWYFLGQDTASGGPVTKAVEAVPGDLLAGGSFELESRTGGAGSTSAWEASPAAPASFTIERSARRTGATGLRADLEAGQWAEHRSPEVALRGSKGLGLRAFLASEGGAGARAGVALESTSGKLAPFEVWSRRIVGTPQLEETAFVCAVPPGYDRARVIVHADAGMGSGVVMADDVSLVERTPPSSSILVHEDRQLYLLGEPAQSALLFKLDHPVLWVAFEETPSRGTADSPDVNPTSDPWSAMEALAHPQGLRLEASDAQRPHRFSFVIDEVQLSLGLATLGVEVAATEYAVEGGPIVTVPRPAQEAGYRTHQAEFSRPGVTDVLAGTGRELVRLIFDSPVDLRGHPVERGFRLEAALEAGAGVTLQLQFKDERAQAEALAREAREATKRGQLGAALASWARLLDEVPFDVTLVRDAEAARGQLLEQGLSEVQRLRAEIERARFFRLVDLYRQCRRAAEDCARRYRGSEVEAAAGEVQASIDQELAGLETDLDRAEARRLAAIHRALLAQQMPLLAERVARSLRERFGVDDPSLLGPSNP